MPYWKISPHEDMDFDSCVMPAATEEDHQNALEYAQDMLVAAWENLTFGDGKASVTIELCSGKIPDFTDYD